MIYGGYIRYEPAIRGFRVRQKLVCGSEQKGRRQDNLLGSGIGRTQDHLFGGFGSLFRV